MSIGTGLAIASSGLGAIDQQLALVSQNIANANTSGYSVETATLTATTAGGQGSGVISGPAQRQVNTGIQAQLNGSTAQQSYQSAISTALSGIDQVMGTPGQGTDLASLLGNVQSAFQSLLTDPSSAVQQGAVVNAAQALTEQIHTIGTGIGAAGQTATTTISADVNTLNATLAKIGTLNSRIISLAHQNKGTADLANQRDIAIQTAISLTGAKAITQPDGSIALFSANGVQLPTTGSVQVAVNATGSGTTFSVAGATLNFGGALGGNQELVNTTLPQIQAGLDSFSQALAARFAGAGLSLFTDPAGNVPGSATPGLSNIITVNPSVTTNRALVRDGNLSVTNAAGTTIPPNPPGGPAGYTTLIQNVLAAAFGTTTVANTAQPPANDIYTNANGTATLPYAVTGNLLTIVTNFTANEASMSSSAQNASTATGHIVSALKAQAGATSGVSIDQQMGLLVTLQNAYAANAKAVTIAQQMWQATEAMIQ